MAAPESRIRSLPENRQEQPGFAGTGVGTPQFADAMQTPAEICIQRAAPGDLHREIDFHRCIQVRPQPAVAPTAVRKLRGKQHGNNRLNIVCDGAVVRARAVIRSRALRESPCQNETRKQRGENRCRLFPPSIRGAAADDPRPRSADRLTDLDGAFVHFRGKNRSTARKSTTWRHPVAEPFIHFRGFAGVRLTETKKPIGTNGEFNHFP